MDFLRGLKTITLPWSTKLIVAALLVAAVVLDVGVFFYSIEKKQEEVTGASLQFIAAVLPIALLTIVLAQADTGVVALQRRTEMFHSRVVAPALLRIAEQASAFYPARKSLRLEAVALPGQVLLNLRRGECYCDYLALVPWEGTTRALLIRLEVNVMRINFNLCIPKALAGRGGLATHFKHSLAGAAAARDAGVTGTHHEPPVSSSGYTFLEMPLARRIEGVDLICLVGSRFVGEEFLWDSAEQLYFAQDLTFMLRAFMTEAPRMFPVIRPGTSPKSLAEVMSSLEV